MNARPHWDPQERELNPGAPLAGPAQEQPHERPSEKEKTEHEVSSMR